MHQLTLFSSKKFFNKKYIFSILDRKDVDMIQLESFFVDQKYIFAILNGIDVDMIQLGGLFW